MKVFATLLLLTISLMRPHSALATWMLKQTETVPIGRVLTNLQDRLSAEKNSVETLYYLARVHSMAYASDLTTINMVTNRPLPQPDFGYPDSDTGVPRKVMTRTNAAALAAAKQHLTNAIAYYQRAATLVLQGTNATELDWLIRPTYLGLAWCVEQDGRRDDAIKAYRKALLLAWDAEIEHKPTITEQLEWSWDKIRAKQNPLSQPPSQRKSIGAGVCFSDEIIGHLLRLLDPQKDAKEIAQLQADRATVQKMGRRVTPILVPLEADAPFETLVNSAASVAFDLDGSGLPRCWGWITPKAAWLVYDHDGSGRITSGLQMFGSVTFWVFWRDGYEVLSSLDDNGDGRLCGAELKGLALWQDRNSNGIADAGEVRSVTEHGVVAIECGSQKHPTGIPFNPRGVVFSDGVARPSYDWIVPSAVVE